jgi:hypothetical protein
MKKIAVGILFLLLLVGSQVSLRAQNARITGKIVDKANQQPMVGVDVILSDAKDSTKSVFAITDKTGGFVFTGVKPKSYKLKTYYLGYAEISQIVEIKGKPVNLGSLVIEEKAKEITEVVVIREAPPAVQKGDTTEMSSNAYKTNKDATAEDLVKKMPGITVENGTVKAHGEDVKKVLIDGKQFFGDDPSVALKNLPADVIEKVQVFNKLSDQAEITGFDDGNSSKTINIITKQNRRTGKFGKFTGGTDFKDKNLLAGTLNLFKGSRRITLIGLDNDVNQQNFSAQDLIGSTGGGGGRGGRTGGGGFTGAPSGITTTKSIGINYTDTWGKKININASYFYNTSKNTLNQLSNTENFQSLYKYVNDSTNSVTQNYNHRFNVRFEYAIDSLNSLIVTPQLSFQSNNSNNFTNELRTGTDNSSTFTRNLSITDASAYNFSNNLVFRHKFMKVGRTFSVGISTSMNDRNSNSTSDAVTNLIPDNQSTKSLSNGYSLSTNISYTEPMGKLNLLQFNYNTSYSFSDIDRETFRVGASDVKSLRLDSLSNIYNNDYITNRGGLAYLIKNKKASLNASVGLDYQRADLKGNLSIPKGDMIKKTFDNFLPNFMLNYKFSSTNTLRIFYRASTNAPSISQLQNVTDNSNRLSLSTGNPLLKQEYNHNLVTRYSFANPTKGTNFFTFINASYTQDNIGSRVIYAQKDTLNLPQYNVKLTPGAQLSVPINMDYAWSLRSFFSYGVLIKPIKCNINILAGFNYSQSPGYLDSLLNRSNSYTFTNGLVLSSNISEKIDFSLSYTSNYSIVNNSVIAPGVSNTKYWYQSSSAKVNWLFWKGFLLQSDMVGQFNQGLGTSYNQSYVVWNGSFGKKLFKNQVGEIKLSVFDILKQNKNISRSVTANYITDTRTNTFPRYFLLVFTYNLKNFNGQKLPADKRDDHDHGPGQGPPPGGFRGGGDRGGPPMP